MADDRLDEALRLHRAGDLAAAEPIYRGMLAAGVETPPAELRSQGIDLGGAGATGKDGGAEDRDAYLDRPGASLRSDDDPEEPQA